MKAYSMPISLIPFKSLIDQTLIESFSISLIDSNVTSTTSKIGGIPYSDATLFYPTDSDGNLMLLLAQINFKEIQLNLPFPSAGLLQIYINRDFGREPAVKQQDEYFIRFIENPKEDNNYFIVEHPMSVGENFPIKKSYKISGSIQLEPVSSLDFRYDNFFSFNKSDQISDDERSFEEIYFETYLGATPKIGGYPYFIENDFRLQDERLKKYDVLLFQLVTDDRYFINYRDSGVINFFINSEQLLKKDFSDVYMHLDTY